MLRTTFAAFADELVKIAEQTAFSEKQYKALYGPKVVRKDKKFTSGKELGSSSTLTNKDEAYHPIGSATRSQEGKETPGGPL